MFTAEDPPTSEASAIARLIYIDCEALLRNDDEERENLRIITKAKEKLSGITARFIQYMLQTYPDPEVIHNRFYEMEKAVGEGVFSRQNAPRIINNVTANYLTWEIFLEFLLFEDAISKKEFEDLRDIHFKNIIKIRDDLLSKCTEEQASNVFLKSLREALSSGKARIEGIGSVEDNRADIIGYCPDIKKGIIFLYPGASYRMVKKLKKEEESNLNHSQESVGKQMLQDGIIVKNQKGSTMYQKTYRGNRSYVWAIDGEKAGLGLMMDDDAQDAIQRKRDNSEQSNILPLPIDKM